MSTTSLFDDHGTPNLGSGSRLPNAAAPETLSELVEAFEAATSQHHPDLDVPVRTLSMSVDGTIVVPGVGSLALTAWSRKQLASRVGLVWDKWAMGIPAQVLAEEITRRLARDSGVVRVKTSSVPGDVVSDGTLRGFVSTSYTTISDAVVAQAILDEARAGDPRILRHTITDRTSTYAIQLGAPLRLTGPAVVGDVRGGLLIRNSDVGYAALVIQLFLHRVVCSNGMVVSENSTIVHRAHRRIDVDVLRAKLAVGLQGVSERLHRAGRDLERAGHHAVANIEAALVDVLRLAHLPLRLLPVMMDAYQGEPHQSVHGVTQALTLGAQHGSVSAEDRLSLERAAGVYVRRFTGQ